MVMDLARRIVAVLLILHAGLAGGGRRDTCASDEARSENGRACVPCPSCPAGQGLDEMCGYGQGGDQECKACEQGSYNSKPGPSRCLPCMKCELYKRVTVYKCRTVVNTECGECMTDHFESFAGMRDSATVLYSCSHCKENVDHAQCAEYTRRQMAHASTTELDTTVTSRDLTTASSQTGPAHWKWLSLLLSVALVLVLFTVFGICCKFRRRYGRVKRGALHIAEAMEMQELIDGDRNNQRRDVEQAKPEAVKPLHRELFERDVEAPANNVKPEPRARAPVARHNAPHGERRFDINHNIVEHKAITQKDIGTLLVPVKPHYVKRSFSDPGTSPVDPGTHDIAGPSTLDTAYLIAETQQPTETSSEVAAAIAKKICDHLATSVCKPTNQHHAGMQDLVAPVYLADRLPKIPPAVVQNAVVCAVPSCASRIAVVPPISGSALKHALNAAVNSAPTPRPPPEQLLEYTPDTSLDEDDVTSIGAESEASTLLLSGRLPQENSDASYAEPEGNLSIEDNEARSFRVQRTADEAPRRRRSTHRSQSAGEPRLNAGPGAEGMATDPEPFPPSFSTSAPDAGHNINITIHCPSYPSIAPFYAGPTYNNINDNSFQNHGNMGGGVNTIRDPANSDDATQRPQPTVDDIDLPPEAIYQPTQAPKQAASLQPGSSGTIHPFIERSLGIRRDTIDSEETTPKTSITGDNYYNYPPTCRQSVQSHGSSSTFPVQESCVYPI